MRYITRDDLVDIARGAVLLGSGGGGSPEGDLLRTDQLLEQYGPVRLLSCEELPDDALVVPVAFVGAPLVSIEKLPSGKEFAQIVQRIEQAYGKKVTALVSAEIGGSNALAAIAAAAPLGVPVVDADTIGRAFPRLEMSSCNLHGIPAAPAFISDSFGRVAVLHDAAPSVVEHYFRALVTAMGSTAAAALYIMDGCQAKRALIRGSISRAKALASGNVPFDSIAEGVVADIEQRVTGGFLVGTIAIKTAHSLVTLEYQNEFLAARKEGQLLVATPDIISCIDSHTCDPLSIEQVRFGQEIVVVSLPADPLWKSDEGMKLVGLEAFGGICV